MNPEIKAKWVKALRSGDYKQTRRELRSMEGDSFCCLGVLCNLHAKEHPEIARLETDPEEYMGMVGKCPPKVLQWSRLQKKSQEKLVSLNDEFGEDFNAIASYIEKNL